MNSLLKRLMGNSLNDRLKRRIRKHIITVATLITLLNGTAHAFTPKVESVREDLYQAVQTEAYQKLPDDEKTDFVISSYGKIISTCIDEIENKASSGDFESVEKGIKYLFQLSEEIQDETLYNKALDLKKQYLSKKEKIVKKNTSAIKIKVSSSYEEQKILALKKGIKEFTLDGQKFYVEIGPGRNVGLARSAARSRIVNRCAQDGLDYNSEFSMAMNSDNQLVVWCAVK